MKRTLAVSVSLLVSSLLVSCFMPRTKQLEQPQTDSAEFARYVNAQQLTTQSLTMLNERGLAETYSSDPGAVITRLKDDFDSAPSPALRNTLTELCADTATSAAPTHWQRAVAYHLAAAELAFQATANGPGLQLAEPLALAAYNYSSGQVARLLFETQSLGPNSQTFAGPWYDYTLYNRSLGKHAIKAGELDALVPAAFIKLKNTEVKRERRSGFGAALVGHRKATPASSTQGPFMPATGLALPLNATLDFSEPDRVLLDFHDISTTSVATLGKRSVPLAADYTAPLVTIYSHVEDPNAAWKGMRHPDHYLDVMGLYQLEWFQPNKIPVIFSHGLISSPKIWLPSLNALFADPVIRNRFQLYVFRYPSGFPIGFNASVLRRWLIDFKAYYDPEGRNPNFRNMIIVGHSMGGLLSSMQIRDSGDSLTRLIFTRPLDQVASLDDEEKSALESLLVYEANPNIKRAVFIAVPHRGSNDATGLRGIIGRKLIEYPNDFLITKPLTELDDLTEFGREIINSRPDGISSLTPHSPQLTAITQQSFSRNLVYHSIIGQKSRLQRKQNSSDGTVAYWSSHLDGADSEKIIFDKHTPMVANPDTIEELRRILYLHAGVSVK